MNYLGLINRFWTKDLEYHFSDKETALYFYLLNVSNSIHWKNPFGLSNAMTIAKFGWGKTSFDNAKNKLKKAGLIDFRPGDGRGNVYRYTIVCDVKGDVKEHEKVYQNVTLYNSLLANNKKGTQISTLFDTLSSTLSDPLSNLKPETSINNKDKLKENKKHDLNFKEIDKNKKDHDRSNKENDSGVSVKEKQVVDLYHSTCVSFPGITRLTASRKEKILRRLAEMGDMATMEKVFKKMESSEFLKGGNKNGWMASFDWVFDNSNNWLKVIEGNYDNQPVKEKLDPRFTGVLETDLNKF